MNRVILVVAAVAISAVAVTSAFTPWTFFLHEAGGSSLSVEASSPNHLNVSFSADWTHVSAYSGGHRSQYYELEVSLAVENNLSHPITAPYMEYSSFRITPFSNVAETPWSYSNTNLLNGSPVANQLEPGQKALMMDQIVLSGNFSDMPGLAHFVNGTISRLTSSHANYSIVTLDSYSMIYRYPATYTFHLVNGSGFKPPVDLYGTYYNVSYTFTV